jgi:hypothetical protein
VAALALGEARRALEGLAGADGRQAELGLVAEGVVQRQGPLVVGRPAVGAQAAVREAGHLVRQFEGGRQGLAGLD